MLCFLCALFIGGVVSAGSADRETIKEAERIASEKVLLKQIMISYGVDSDTKGSGDGGGHVTAG
ncbi:MAG: hypothetical protein A2583_16030 [Bdellovibrionales bacterium RIFOXYD1_FULL_53_11]|nr:MAG: hypothetical protein A2583_16030 [Bdellovibrionales bacterium RIFOXYD1_FULL_53_11]